MQLIRTLAELKSTLSQLRQKEDKIGLVPTMGALHMGHISLVNRALQENEIVIASIFVNPAQFNDKKDLEKYPRTPEADIRLLKEAGCQFAFLPEVKEMIPDENYEMMDFGTLETVMEGAFRPGHFKGMAMIVSRFFELVKPDRAYFGEKDFQQLAIIREMNRRNGGPIEIIGCTTVREEDGLAMSSRNIHLTGEERAESPVIYRSLLAAAEMIRESSVEETRAMVKENIEASGLFRVQYFEMVDADTLQPIESWDPYHAQRACIAVITSKTRLIDNIAL